MNDEASALRARLEEGELAALLDPLLPLVLLDDPGEWWRRASEACGLPLLAALAEALTAIERLAALEAWRRDLAPGRRPPRGWDQVRREIAQRPRWALTLALDLLLIEPDLALDPLLAQRRLARQLVERLPDERPASATDAIAALAVLDQWPVS